MGVGERDVRTFLVLNLGLDRLNALGWVDIESDGLASKVFDENLHRHG